MIRIGIEITEIEQASFCHLGQRNAHELAIRLSPFDEGRKPAYELVCSYGRDLSKFR
jgi:hypothetical protein